MIDLGTMDDARLESLIRDARAELERRRSAPVAVDDGLTATNEPAAEAAWEAEDEQGWAAAKATATAVVTGPAKALAVLRALPTVEAIKPWNDRHYLNFRGFRRDYRGDSNLKIYVDREGRVVYQKGRGLYSEGVQKGIAEVEAACLANGLELIRM